MEGSTSGDSSSLEEILLKLEESVNRLVARFEGLFIDVEQCENIVEEQCENIVEEQCENIVEPAIPAPAKLKTEEAQFDEEDCPDENVDCGIVKENEQTVAGTGLFVIRVCGGFRGLEYICGNCDKWTLVEFVRKGRKRDYLIGEVQRGPISGCLKVEKNGGVSKTFVQNRVKILIEFVRKGRKREYLISEVQSGPMSGCLRVDKNGGVSKTFVQNRVKIKN